MTDVASVPIVTEDIKPDTGKLFVDDKKSRSDIECFVHAEYFIPKTEEHLIRPPVAPEEKKTDQKKEGKKKRPIVKIDIRDKLCNSLIDVRPGAEFFLGATFITFLSSSRFQALTAECRLFCVEHLPTSVARRLRCATLCAYAIL